jgi:hypothetical protein
MSDGWTFLSSADAKAMEAWKSEFFGRALEETDMILADHAAAIEEMIGKQGAEWLFKSLLPQAVKKNTKGELHFACTLTQNVLLSSKVITDADRKQALAILAPSTIDGIKLSGSGCGYLAGLAWFREGLVAAELRDELTQLQNRISQQSTLHKLGPYDSNALGWGLYDFLGLLTTQFSATFTTEHAGWYKDLMLKCILSIVGFEPEAPRTWTQPRKGCGECEACRHLDAFLVHPHLNFTSLARSLPVRKHLAERLGCRFIGTREIRDANSGFTLKTNASKSPHALEITKRHSTYEQQHRAWKGRAERVQPELRRMGSPQRMQSLLGADAEDILSLRIVTLKRNRTGRTDGQFQAAMPLMSGNNVTPSAVSSTSSSSQGALAARNANRRVSNNGAAAHRAKRAAPDADENQHPSKRPAVIDLT